MVVSPTKRSRRSDSPFSKEQEIWIVLNAGNLSAIEIRRKYIRHFHIRHMQAVPRARCIATIVERFKRTGGVTGSHDDGSARRSAVSPANIARVEEYFVAHSTHSLSVAARGHQLHVIMENHPKRAEMVTFSLFKSQSAYRPKQSRPTSVLSMGCCARGRLGTESHLE